MIKLIIFDLDGVLIDSKQTHYEALNRALGEEYAISIEEHLATFDGLPTRSKLDMLSDRKGLPTDRHASIARAKQKASESDACPETACSLAARPLLRRPRPNIPPPD